MGADLILPLKEVVWANKAMLSDRASSHLLKMLDEAM
jgi:hypothetical protein